MYCHKCFSLLEDDDTVCSVCSQTINRKKLANSGSYFINSPIEIQLKNLLEKVTVASHLHNSNTKTDDNVRDITDEILYKNLYCRSNSDTNVITLALNSDGVPVFKSSAFPIWSLLCTVN